MGAWLDHPDAGVRAHAAICLIGNHCLEATPEGGRLFGHPFPSLPLFPPLFQPCFPPAFCLINVWPLWILAIFPDSFAADHSINDGICPTRG